MLRPTIIENRFDSSFYILSKDSVIPKGYTANKSELFIPNQPITVKYENQFKGFAALQDVDKWYVKEITATVYPGSLLAGFTEQKHFNAWAVPIDPRMTLDDINGATRIYPNDTNTGWLFAHAHENDHHERVILLEAIMHTLFEDLVHSKLEDVLKKVVGSDNPSPQAGTELLYTYNSQFGSLSNYSNLIAFRQECVKWCSETEKLLHLGQHVQEDDHYLQHQLVRAIKQAKLIWKADTGKARSLATIESQVDAIIARVETDHEIDTRWVKAAKAEAARKAAEAAANENNGGNDNG